MDCNKKTLKIALIGTRGIPARYGGFETCVQEIGQRLAQKGHNVFVYCRHNHYNLQTDLLDSSFRRTRSFLECKGICSRRSYLGMTLVYLPALSFKSLETLSHTCLATLHALFMSFDIYMYFNTGNAPFLLPLKIFKKSTAINTDGLEWQRSKWGWFGRQYYRICEKLACRFSSALVTDSRGMQEYYRLAHQTNSACIAYGADIPDVIHGNLLKELGLEPGEYFLQITRFEPENHPLMTIKAYNALDCDKKLVLVGDVSYPSGYSEQIFKYRSDKIILPGYIFDNRLLTALWANCLACIHGNSVGGTNPALLQAMAHASLVISYDVIFNREVLQDTGLYFRTTHELTRQMKRVLNGQQMFAAMKQKAQDRIRKHYSWDMVTAEYEKLFFSLTDGRP